MNKDKLKELVNALDELSDKVKDWEVNMLSWDKPACGTPGSHAGLISIVAKDLPKLQDIYNDDCRVHNNSYEDDVWADVLAVFLGFKNMQDLKRWAKDNPKLWGNKYGYDMFCSWQAVTKYSDKILIHRDIINHWKQILVNIEA
jgi:hypothetical protein